MMNYSFLSKPLLHGFISSKCIFVKKYSISVVILHIFQGAYRIKAYSDVDSDGFKCFIASYKDTSAAKHMVVNSNLIGAVLISHQVCWFTFHASCGVSMHRQYQS
jgi:hypothetical protein